MEVERSIDNLQKLDLNKVEENNENLIDELVEIL